MQYKQVYILNHVDWSITVYVSSTSCVHALYLLTRIQKITMYQINLYWILCNSNPTKYFRHKQELSLWITWRILFNIAALFINIRRSEIIKTRHKRLEGPASPVSMQTNEHEVSSLVYNRCLQLVPVVIQVTSPNKTGLMYLAWNIQNDCKSSVKNSYKTLDMAAVMKSTRCSNQKYQK